jgi:N-acetylglucosamine-6-phosphate deacetylase
VGIVTLAPEIDGGLDLIRALVSHGHHVSLGHSGATYEQAQEGIRAGARQATHSTTPDALAPAPGLAGRSSPTSDRELSATASTCILR